MSISHFCCNDMKTSIIETELVHYNDIFDEYGILLPEDRLSIMLLKYCPWCGKKLSCSKRDEWFKKLENLGFDAPLFDDKIPEQFKTSEWRENNKTGDSSPSDG